MQGYDDSRKGKRGRKPKKGRRKVEGDNEEEGEGEDGEADEKKSSKKKMPPCTPVTDVRVCSCVSEEAHIQHLHPRAPQLTYTTFIHVHCI